ncbi:uncharacterized protein LOC127277869 [Leptopilina boulardi]|uniref:uncharacterized protein LOC127277869 n=1 Tax=Leptopilina boulardi TaxID=63433 RepID=UPI0021F5DBD1|nr:uncharacterized protein LOC127277869 [Leptopilina boulardi]
MIFGLGTTPQALKTLVQNFPIHKQRSYQLGRLRVEKRSLRGLSELSINSLRLWPLKFMVDCVQNKFFYLKMESNNISAITKDCFSTTEELENLQPGDTSYELTGVIIKIETPLRRKSGLQVSSENAPMRCIFSNLERKIRVLFWPPKRDEFKERLLNKIMKPQIIESNPQYFKTEEGLLLVEISIQKFTEVEILNPWIPEEDSCSPVELKNCAEFIGRRISVVGYLKTPFQSIVQGNSSYGSGAITDLTFRLPINITSFDGISSPCRGACVEIKGQLRTNNYKTIILQVDSMSDISKANDEVMTVIEMRKGVFVLIPEENKVPDARKKSLPEEKKSCESKKMKKNSSQEIMEENEENLNMEDLLI